MMPITNKTERPRRSDFTLAWEIGLVLIVKFMLLWLLWHFFFSAPKAKHMRLPEPQVIQHVLSDRVSDHTGQPSSSIPTPESTPHD